MSLPPLQDASHLPSAMPLWAAILLSYFLGALPFGFMLAKALRGVDLRAVGSGNIGATNAMRVLGRPLGLVAFALDVAKGWVPVAVLAPLAAPEDAIGQVLCGTGAVLGHCFPLYLGFKGGKGVATGCGAVIGIDPRVFLAGGVVWLVTLGVSRFVGLSSILMGCTFPLVTWALHRDQPALAGGAGLLTVLILVRHRANISRMRRGTEPRIAGRRRKGGPR